MNANSRKNRKLIEQYPVVANIINEHMLPIYLGTNGTRLKGPESVDNLTIKVQKADGDLCFKELSATGLYDNSLIFSTEASRKSQIAREAEYVFAVDKNDKILNRLNPGFPPEKGENSYPTYVSTVMWATRSGHVLSDPMWDKIKCLILVTVTMWHEDLKNDEPSRFGKTLERNLEIIIYKKPNCGFRELHNTSSRWSNLRLTSKSMMRAMFDKDCDIIQMNGCLWELCKFFQAEVWDKGMKQAYDRFYQESKTRGASGQFGSTKLLVADLCDYHRVMLENGKCWISFQLRPGGIDMYVLGCDGTLPQLRELVRPMVLMWIQNPECHMNFKGDGKVSVM